MRFHVVARVGGCQRSETLTVVVLSPLLLRNLNQQLKQEKEGKPSAVHNFFVLDEVGAALSPQNWSFTAARAPRLRLIAQQRSARIDPFLSR